MLVVSDPTAAVTELTPPPAGCCPHPLTPKQLMGKLSECPKPPSRLLLQENIQPPSTKAAKQLLSLEAGTGRAEAAHGGTPALCPGKEGQGHACVTLHRWLHSTPSCQQPLGERRRLSPLGMLCPEKPSAGAAVQPCRDRGCPWKSCPRNANPRYFSYCLRGER